MTKTEQIIIELKNNNWYWEMPSSYSWTIVDDKGKKIPRMEVYKKTGMKEIDIWQGLYGATTRCNNDGTDEYRESN